MKILIIEDEQKSALYLKNSLSESGYQVSVSHDGIDGLFMAQSGEFDLLILDVMLPGIDGWKIIERLREHSTIPVLFLTARDGVEDRVKGLELGGDDYLVKPFAYTELLARVRSLLRRPPLRPQDSLSVGDLHIDVLKRRVQRAGQRIELTNKEFALLQLLVQHQGQVLSRSQIASQVWDMNFDSDTNVVDVAIRRLRVKVDDGFEHKLIQTVRGMGYRVEEYSA
ncbi:heavy metal response regulator transcription factor [Comamonas avium]|jgi:two-component system copper resistance phosphate regulon response regulator CusR|uniref:Heavy metal response regulator transcription factor n=1 Tax=Comamonas avium TaxID=2762231 RepID=A0ABR8SET2_9BURK|nr:heavy metal response regulator transcription factor [Comamonas avium]MBD7962007.1 heavy metal response regulator transcription factor [Comamonas avium]